MPISPTSTPPSAGFSIRLPGSRMGKVRDARRSRAYRRAEESGRGCRARRSTTSCGGLVEVVDRPAAEDRREPVDRAEDSEADDRGDERRDQRVGLQSSRYRISAPRMAPPSGARKMAPIPEPMPTVTAIPRPPGEVEPVERASSRSRR